MHDPNAFREQGHPPHDPSARYREPFYPPIAVPQAAPLAIASLVCGILAWTAAPFVCAIIAIITGHMALGEIRRDPQRVGGRGMAIVGMISGYIQMILAALVIAFFVLVFGYAFSRAPAIRETVTVRPAIPAPNAPPGTIGASGDDIDRRVASVLAPIAKMPAENIDPTDLLADDLKLRDTDRIDLIVKLEEEFRIKLRPGESQTWKTVADVAGSIHRREPSLATPRSDPGTETADPPKAPNP